LPHFGQQRLFNACLSDLNKVVTLNVDQCIVVFEEELEQAVCQLELWHFSLSKCGLLVVRKSIQVEQYLLPVEVDSVEIANLCVLGPKFLAIWLKLALGLHPVDIGCREQPSSIRTYFACFKVLHRNGHAIKALVTANVPK